MVSKIYVLLPVPVGPQMSTMRLRSTSSLRMKLTLAVAALGTVMELKALLSGISNFSSVAVQSRHCPLPPPPYPKE